MGGNIGCPTDYIEVIDGLYREILDRNIDDIVLLNICPVQHG